MSATGARREGKNGNRSEWTTKGLRMNLIDEMRITAMDLDESQMPLANKIDEWLKDLSRLSNSGGMVPMESGSPVQVIHIGLGEWFKRDGIETIYRIFAGDWSAYTVSARAWMTGSVEVFQGDEMVQPVKMIPISQYICS